MHFEFLVMPFTLLNAPSAYIMVLFNEGLPSILGYQVRWNKNYEI